MERVQDLSGRRGGTALEYTEPGVASVQAERFTSDDILDEGTPLLRVHLVYQDSATGARGTRLLEFLAENLELETDLQMTATVFESITVDQDYTGERQAAEADILLVSAHGEKALPLAVVSWIQKWLRQRQPRPRALVLSFDAAAHATGWVTELESRLRNEARSSAVDLFAHFGELRGSREEYSTEDIQYRAQARTSVLDEALRWDQPGSHWGINE